MCLLRNQIHYTYVHLSVPNVKRNIAQQKKITDKTRNKQTQRMRSIEIGNAISWWWYPLNRRKSFISRICLLTLCCTKATEQHRGRVNRRQTPTNLPSIISKNKLQLIWLLIHIGSITHIWILCSPFVRNSLFVNLR